jgi:iron(III) transport system ATP-binding protein
VQSAVARRLDRVAAPYRERPATVNDPGPSGDSREGERPSLPPQRGRRPGHSPFGHPDVIVSGVPNLDVLPAHTSSTRYRDGAADLVATGVCKSFDDTPVLRGVDLSVPAGTIVSLLGPSGCGKTTLLRSVAGLERPDSGEVRLGSRVMSSPRTWCPPEHRRIGMVFQDWALFPHLNVARNVGFGLTRTERRSGRVLEALELVGLVDFADRMPGTLSGGQQQRVALARALANRPAAVLLDEPFSNLDATLRVQIRMDVQRLLRDLGVTALFVTHDQEEAFVVGEIVAVMFDGVVVQQARPAEMYDAPATRAVAEFIGDANILPGVASGDTVETALGKMSLLSDASGMVEVLARPEYVRVDTGNEATIEDIEFYGHDAVYIVRPDEGRPIRARVLMAPEFGPGDRVSLSYIGGPTVAFAVETATSV